MPQRVLKSTYWILSICFLIRPLWAACECVEYKTSEQIEIFDLVILAKVTDLRVLEKGEDVERRIYEGESQGKVVPHPAGNVEGTFHILHSWKGKPTDPITLAVDQYTTCGDYNISVGDVLLLYISSYKGKLLGIGKCDAKKLESASEEIEKLNSFTGKVYTLDSSVKNIQH
jgi:hypothetical protein